MRLVSFWLLLGLISTAQSQQSDVVFIVDGSGSIDSTDFQIQKDGIIAAIRDPNRLPLDSSIAVGLVQFASSAQTEVPLTVISDATVRESVIVQIEGMSQMGGSTGPGYGINQAEVVLQAGARASAKQSFCLTTDGTRNTGPLLLTARQSAIDNQDLEELSVIGIEDGSSFSESIAEAEYGPLVYGNGDFLFTRAFAEFANSVASVCFPSGDIELVGMEVTQVIQDLKNSIKLIEKKSTLVRTFFQSPTGTTVPITARLIGRDSSGNDLSGSPLVPSFHQSILASTNALDRRENFADSLNFELPPSWTDAGSIELEVEYSGGNLICNEPDGNSDCISPVQFIAGSEVEVKFVPIRHTTSGGTVTEVPTGNLTILERRMLALLPTSRIDLIIGRPLSLNTDPLPASDVISELKAYRILDMVITDAGGSYINPFPDLDRYYYAPIATSVVLENDSGRAIGGRADDIPGIVSCGKYRDSGSYGSNRHVHEIGHTMGLRHVGNVDNSFCLAARGAVPFPTQPITDSSGNANQVTTIGPLSPDQDVIYGWDDREKEVVDPTKLFEMMSYCGNERWISGQTYETIRNHINGRFNTVRKLKQVSTQRSLSTVTEFCIYHGKLNRVSKTASLLPVKRLALSGTIPDGLTSPSGLFHFRTLDVAGGLLSDIMFDPQDLSDPDVVDPNAPAAIADNISTYILVAPCDTISVGSVDVLDDVGTTLTTVLVSSSPPTVQVTYPNGGESLSGDSVTIQWTATDPDGDPLSFWVAFSPDNGDTWATLALDHPSTSLQVPLGDLGETTQGLIRVQASDVFNTAQDTSDATFITPNAPPQIKIALPLDGSIFSGIQPITLQALTFDREDGNLDSSVVWTSSLDGTIVSGTTANLLTEGDHEIEAEVEDSKGAQAKSQIVKISVFRIAPALPEVPEAGSPKKKTSWRAILKTLRKIFALSKKKKRRRRRPPTRNLRG